MRPQSAMRVRRGVIASTRRRPPRKKRRAAAVLICNILPVIITDLAIYLGYR